MSTCECPAALLYGCVHIRQRDWSDYIKKTEMVGPIKQKVQSDGESRNFLYFILAAEAIYFDSK